MEDAAYSESPATGGTASKFVFFSQWLPYIVAACLMAWGTFQTWRVLHLKRELVEQQASLEIVRAQKAETAERQNMADLRMTPLQAKDPAYSAAAVAVAWNPALAEGIVTIANLPAPSAGHDYQLWVLDPRSQAPLNAGVIDIAKISRTFDVGTVGASGPGFAVSLEPSGDGSTLSGPILFAVAPQE
jgi:anti-sigma-K factor RskA